MENTAEGNGQKEVVNAKFVLGGDGAHSWVRSNLGIQMEGDTTGEY